MNRYTSIALVVLILLGSYGLIKSSTLTQVNMIDESPELVYLRMTKDVMETWNDKSVFGNCYATVILFVTMDGTNSPSWKINLSSDPVWSRIVFGDYYRWLKTFGEEGSGVGQFNNPHGTRRESFIEGYSAREMKFSG